MDTIEYKEKKLEKIIRDVTKKINNIPSLGFGSEVDNLVKVSMINFMVSLAYISEIREDNIDVITESIIDELEVVSSEMVSNLLELSRVK